MTDKLYILYASDLAKNSQIAPGGIGNSILHTIRHMPEQIALEAWGVHPHGASEPSVVTKHEGSRAYRFRALLEAGPVTSRRVPLNLRYMGALAREASALTHPGRHVVIAHRMEYVAAIASVPTLRPKPPLIMVSHGSSKFSPIAMPRWKAAAFARLEAIAIARASAVVLVSQDGLEYYRERYPAYQHKFRHIPNPVDTDRFFPQDRALVRRQLAIPATVPLFCYHGRMEQDKGVYLLLDTFAAIQRQLPEAQILLVGDGRELEGMRQYTERAALRGVHFLGSVAHEDVVNYLSASDVSLLTSRFEGMSLGVLESLACATPVVATDVGDNAVLIRPGLSGETVAQHNAEALAEAAIRTYHDRTRLSESCRSVVKPYTPAAQVEALLNLATDCLDGQL